MVLDTNILISAALLPGLVPARLLHHVLAHGRLMADLSAVAAWVTPGRTERHSRDPDDDAFIHAAIEGVAAWLVNGDDDLLVLGRVESVRILRPAQALKLLTSS